MAEILAEIRDVEEQINSIVMMGLTDRLETRVEALEERLKVLKDRLEELKNL